MMCKADLDMITMMGEELTSAAIEANSITSLAMGAATCLDTFKAHGESGEMMRHSYEGIALDFLIGEIIRRATMLNDRLKQPLGGEEPDDTDDA